MTELVVDRHPLLSVAPSPAVVAGAEPAFLEELRGVASSRFEAMGLPSRKTEAWRFTGVNHLADAELVAPQPSATAPAFDALPGAVRLVFVDGLFRPELSNRSDLPTGVEAVGLAEALQTEPASLDRWIGRHPALLDHPFAALNTARFPDGAIIRIDDGVVIDRPIQLLLLGSDNDRAALSLPRLVIVAGRASQATVVEHHRNTLGESLSCPVTEISLDEGAVLDHYRIVEDGPEATHIATVAAQQARDSVLRNHAFTLGGALVRNDLFVSLEGEGADATLDGLYLTGDRQHVDNQILVHHRVPHCTSHQLYKGVLDDRSRAVFNGRIVVDPGAQKTDARQSNRNLLLSETALVHSNPQLEIFADDVRCTHGSTIGRLDQDAVFYLRSRGIDRVAAEGLLTFAFASEVVDRVSLESVRDALREVLVQRLPGTRLVREAM